jgi:hypothetical protein
MVGTIAWTTVDMVATKAELAYSDSRSFKLVRTDQLPTVALMAEVEKSLIVVVVINFPNPMVIRLMSELVFATKEESMYPRVLVLKVPEALPLVAVSGCGRRRASRTN